MNNKIAFFGLKSPLKQLYLPGLKQALKATAHQNEYTIINIDYILITKAKMLELNRDYLQHNYDTDIITFDFSDTSKNIIAEIYICPQTVGENALRFKTPSDHELVRVVSHGLLHLCGYGDKTTLQRKVMRGMETLCLNLYLNSVRL